MRLTVVFIVALFLVAFAAGYLTISFRIHDSVPSIGITEIQSLRARFLTEYEPSARFSMSELGDSLAIRELLQPGVDLPATDRFESVELSALYDFSETCSGSEKKKVRSTVLEKAWVWHEFMCKKRAELPAAFFSLAPFVHPSGTSYVFRAWRSGRFLEVRWLAKNLAYSLPGEWAKFPADTIGEGRKLVSSFSRQARAALLASDSAVIQSPWVWFSSNKDGDRSNAENLYFRFAEGDLRHFLAKTSFEVVALPESGLTGCLMSEGNLCWRWDARKSFQRTRLYSLILALAAFVLGLMTAIVFVLQIRKQRIEDARKRFALRMLTHELRTPVATLLLQNDNLRSYFDELPGGAQDAALLMNEEIQRLRRLAEVSGQYLRNSGRSLIEPQAHLISSTREFLIDLLLERGLNEIN